MSYENLLSHDFQRNYEVSEQLYRDTLAQREKMLGKQHPDTLQSKNDSGVLLKAQSKFGESKELYQEVPAERSSFSYLNIPPTTVEEAMEYRNIDVLRQLLRERFDLVASGEYSWLRELDIVGYTCDEIADLLFEQANDAPWIYFKPEKFDPIEVRAGVHVPGCAHGCSSLDQSPRGRTSTPQPFKSCGSPNVIRTIQELCGLAGVVPVSRDAEKWIGSVNFQEQNSVAVVSYSPVTANSKSEHSIILSNTINALVGFCCATGQVQAAGLCCESFTILRRPRHDPYQQSQTIPTIELCRVDFELALRLLEELRRLSALDKINAVDTLTMQHIVSQILSPLRQASTEFRPDNDIVHILHSCSLAAQFMCLGFLSYSQAHVGALQPFFLDTPLTKIQLLGNQTTGYQYNRIEYTLATLTCVSNMTRGPVLTFNMLSPSRTPSLVGWLERIGNDGRLQCVG